MENKETLIRALHEKLMKKFMDQVDELVNSIQLIEEAKAATPGTTAAVADTPKQEAAGPDKLNVIRHTVAADQDLVILNPDKQNELLELLKQAYEEFEHQLRSVVSEDNSVAELTAQKFKDELLAKTIEKLTEKKHAFAQ